MRPLTGSCFIRGLVAVFVVSWLGAGCSSEGESQASSDNASPPAQIATKPPAKKHSDKKLSQRELLSKIERAGLTVERMDTSLMQPYQQDKLFVSPETVFSIKVSDGKGNREPMTLLQFKSAKDADNVRGVNGFPVHNWFVLGTVSNYFKDQIESAAL